MATWQFKRNKERKKPVLITESWCPNKQKLPLQQLVSIFQRTVLAISFEEEHCCPEYSRYLSHVDIEYINAACVMLLLYISQYTFHFLLPVFSVKWLWFLCGTHIVPQLRPGPCKQFAFCLRLHSLTSSITRLTSTIGKACYTVERNCLLIGFWLTFRHDIGTNTYCTTRHCLNPQNFNLLASQGQGNPRCIKEVRRNCGKMCIKWAVCINWHDRLKISKWCCGAVMKTWWFE